MIGQTISHYKLLEKLGSGGMGEVWKAEDIKLGRQVALKFLASHLVSDPEIHKRFEREAKAAASLSHPNICTIHEIDEADGKSFLAMELVKGESLEARIEKGPLPLQDALDIARQIAEGLQEAHAAGVVHRDIKPGNIILTPEGRVKILDFGLALLTEGSKLTKLDTTVGTVAYMSPEQTQGADVDHRTDIWSLGVVIYEMVTGEKPFKGAYDKAIMYSILNEEYEPITGVRAGVPMELEVFVGKCLAKDAKDRYDSASDIAKDLRSLGEKLKSGRSTIFKAVASATEIQEGEKLTQPGVRRDTETQATSPTRWIAGAAAVAVLAFWAGQQLSSSGPDGANSLEHPIRFQVMMPAGLQLGQGIALSPDGRWLALTIVERGQAQIWLHDFENSSTDQLAGTQGGTRPFWSPDGRYLGFAAGDRLKSVEIARQLTQTICSFAGGVFRGGSWAADGTILFASRFGAYTATIFRVPEAGGQPTPVWESENADGQGRRGRWPFSLPDGRSFLYQDPNRDSVHVGPDSSPEQPLLARSDSRIEYGAGRLFYVLEGKLLAHRFDIQSSKIIGGSVPVAERVDHVPGPSFGNFSVTSNLLAYHRASASALVWMDREGREIGLIGEVRLYDDNNPRLRLSPDGRRVAIAIRDPETWMRDVWLLDVSGNRMRRVTTAPDSEFNPVWAPDGAEIVFSADPSRVPRLYRLPASGGEPERMLPGMDVEMALDWQPLDGRFLLYRRQSDRTGQDIWGLPMFGDAEPFPFLASPANEGQARFSPDGRCSAG